MFRVEALKCDLAKKIECIYYKNLVKVVDANESKNYCILPEVLTRGHLERILSMEVFEDDIWIVTNPKCGTTWTQEMVCLIVKIISF